MRDWKIMSSN